MEFNLIFNNNKCFDAGEINSILKVPEVMESYSHSRSFLKKSVIKTVYTVDVEYGFKIFISIKNVSDELINGFYSINCLSLLNTLFSDSDWSRTYYKYNNNLFSYLDSDFYGKTDKKYLSSDFHRITCMNDDRFLYPRLDTGKWGITYNKSDDGVMAVDSPFGNESMVIMFEDAYSLQSCRSLKWRCIHSNSFFGDIEPGVEIEKHGFVLMLPYSVKKSWPTMEDFNNA